MERLWTRKVATVGWLAGSPRIQVESNWLPSISTIPPHRCHADRSPGLRCGRSSGMVQSFDKNRTGFDDFVAFADAFGTPILVPGKLSRPKKLGEVMIRLGWTENPIHVARN